MPMNTPPDEPAATEHDALRALLHRWFVQYNPVYLASAALVLAGFWLVSREASQISSGLGRFGVAATAEVYALALIGGAALLMRIEQRRPAVMLGLLAVLYQGDLTLHVETSAYLGAAGRVASLVWLVLFVAKLYALAAALQLRASRSALVVPALAALGLAVIPHVLRDVGTAGRSTSIALFVFAIGAAALWTHRRVESALELDVRGRRALGFTWIAWAVLGLGHVLYWAVAHRIPIFALLAAIALLATRIVSERRVWIIAGATLGTVGVMHPASLSTAALMVAAVLALHAVRRPVLRRSCPPSPAQPYREAELAAPPAIIELAFEHAPAESMSRLLLGSGCALHLAFWTLGWHGDGWPEHVVALDLALAVACTVAAWRLRRPLIVAPALATYAHLLIRAGWIAAPSSAAQWGVAAIAIGFALLVGPLLASWYLHRRARGSRW
ncbi:MAG: hypothetical protein M3Y87_36060, partial [Myxococcota bacterium]|nr:hypothetical protein [Myxococcota bacterium]